MSQSKEQIETALSHLNPTNGEVFKTKKENDFSVTPHGYMLITNAKMYPKTFVAKLDKAIILAPSTLISLKKIFVSPYFIKGMKVYYFDELIHTQICIHGSLQNYILHLKSVDKFNIDKK
jgi:hypothetical protein